MSNLPWASGPREILKHGHDLLKKDTDTNRRLAIISIDNSVELMIKTFLGLPKRLNGLKITRKEYDDFSESFPKLVDALEHYAPDKVIGIDLGEIEWYHRLRNQLYHQGNGLTVEKNNVEVYAQLANILFKNLFGQELIIPASDSKDLLGSFLSNWVILETGMHYISRQHSLLGIGKSNLTEAMKFLKGASLMEDESYKEINKLRKLRNSIIHGEVDYKEVLNEEIVSKVELYANLYDAEGL